MTPDDWTNIGLILGLLYERFVSLEPHGTVSVWLTNTVGKPTVSFETCLNPFHFATVVSLSLLSELPAAAIAKRIGDEWAHRRDH